MNALTAEAEVDSQGWLSIRTPAPRDVSPGKLEVLVVWTPAAQPPAAGRHPRAGTLPGAVGLAPDFHAPLEDFRPYLQ
jgi:hypothetical protein